MRRQRRQNREDDPDEFSCQTYWLGPEEAVKSLLRLVGLAKRSAIASEKLASTAAPLRAIYAERLGDLWAAPTR